MGNGVCCRVESGCGEALRLRSVKSDQDEWESVAFVAWSYHNERGSTGFAALGTIFGAVGVVNSLGRSIDEAVLARSS